MAEPLKPKPSNTQPFKITKIVQDQFIKYLGKLLDASKSRTDLRNRLDNIDYAYTRYQQAIAAKDKTGQDTYGSVPCNALADRPVVNPIVISQVQGIVAYLGEVYLSGYPIFPVVSSPSTKAQAESLEGLIQDHLMLSESIPELQLLFQSLGRYNLGAVEPSWAPIKTYKPSISLEPDKAGQTETKEDIKHINKLTNINLRNLHFDASVDIKDIDSEGSHIGYTKLINRVTLKDLCNYLTNEGLLASTSAVNAALESSFDSDDYNDTPILNDWSTKTKEINWDVWGGWTPAPAEGFRKVPSNSTGLYLLHTFYLRIIPSDFNLDVPRQNQVQVWKVRMVNRSTILSIEPFTAAQGRLGIFIGQAIEDGLDIQTQSYAEMATPIQDATTRMFNIYFQGAKRGLSDRALYNPELIRASDINSPVVSAKIPINANALTDNPFDSAYRNIPFDGRGTENALQSAVMISQWQDQLSGMNNASRGQFQKGNKTREEFSTIMGNSENRMRMPALTIEYRFMVKIKEQLKLNILQFGQDTIIINPRNKKSLEVKISELQTAQLQFEIADGYTPASKMASTEAITALMQLIGTSPQLQQVMGSQLPGMLSHLAQLMGVRGFDEYTDLALEEWQKSFKVQQQLAALLQQLAQQQPQEGPNSAQEGASTQEPVQQ